MKKKMNKMLATMLAVATVVTGIAFPTAAYGAQDEAKELIESDVLIEDEQEYVLNDSDRLIEEDKEKASKPEPESDAKDEAGKGQDIDADQYADPGDYTFNTKWTVWSQSGFNNETVKKYGCRMIAYSKMLVQTGAVPMSAVENGSFNPGIFYDWCASNGWISGMIDEVGDPAGQCPGDFAKKVYGTDLSVTKIQIEGLSDDQKKDKIMELVNAGYAVILGCTQHFVCVDLDATKSNNYPYIQESYSKDPGQTVKVENGNFSLGTYTNIRYWTCSGNPSPVPDPQPGDVKFTGKCGDNLTWTLKEDSTEKGYYIVTVSGTGAMYDYPERSYDDPSTLTPWEASIIQIKGNETNYGIAYIKDVVLEEGITRIGNYAFPSIGYYSADKCLKIPDSVKEIGQSAFAYSRYEEVVIPEGATRIEKRAFASSDLLSVVLPDSIEEIGDSAFVYCANLTSVSPLLPAGLKRLGHEAFYQCEKLQSTLTIPSGLMEIGDGAFGGCVAMKGDSLTFPEEISVGFGAFEDCAGLTGKVTIPGTMWDGHYQIINQGEANEQSIPIRNMPAACFKGCTGITGVEIQEGLEQIGSWAFYNCTGLTGELVIPTGCEVDRLAFMNCSSINKLTISKRKPKSDPIFFGQSAFENCSGLTGTLVLNGNDFSVGDMGRVFLGTGYDSVYIEGYWWHQSIYDPEYGGLKGKDKKGSYFSLDELEYLDGDLATFPKDVTIYYDDKYFISERDASGKPGWEEGLITGALDNLGYSYKSFSSAGIDSPEYYVREVEGEHKIVSLNDSERIYLTPCQPMYVDDSDRVQITIEDESIATLEYKPARALPFWYIIPHKVGKTSYTVSINTHDYGLQTAKGTITVTGNANQSEHRVTFVLNGGECTDLGYWKDKPDDVTKGEDIIEASYIGGVADITKLPLPVYEGRKFEGWYQEGSKKATKKIAKKTTSDLVLYARWSAPYRVILHDGTSAKTYKGFVLNKSKALAANPFKRKDAAMVGWSLSEDSKEVVYLNKEKLLDPEPVLEDGILTLNLYTVWQSDFTISVDLEGGDYSPKEQNRIPEAYTFAEVSKKAITLPKSIIRDGYKFKGLYDTFTDKKITKITKTTCRDYNLVARWTPLTYQIEYNANVPKGLRAKGKMSSQKMTFGMEDAMPLRANAFTLEGYTFRGWSTDPASTEAEFCDEDTFRFGEDGYKKKVTLYAVWGK